MRRLAIEAQGILLVLALSLSSASGSPRSATASETAVIVPPDSSEARLLVAFEMPEVPAGQEINYAELKFEMADLPELIELELYEVSTAWSSGSVSWENPWGVAGGDIREVRAGSWITDDRTGNLVKFDITDSIKRIASGTVVNHGFVVVVVDPHEFQAQSLANAPVVTVWMGP